MIVSICGPSNAGKSRLAKATAHRLGATIASRVPTDYFLLPRRHDAPLAWDWPLLRRLLALPIGSQATTPDLDFDTLKRRRASGGLPFTIRPVMLCDAMAPCPGSDLVVLLDASAPVRRARMVERDMRWGTTVAGRWPKLDETWSAVRSEISPDIALDGALSPDTNARRLADLIRHYREAGDGIMTDPLAIPTGTPVVSLDGETLGSVREIQDYYILVDQPDAHDDLKVPSDAVGEVVDGTLHLTVNRSALSAVDDEESAHRGLEENGA